MGTPYVGTKYDNFLTKNMFSDFFNCESAQNILDETIQNEVHSLWEETVEINPNLKLHAIAGTFSLSFLIGLLSEDYEAIEAEYISVGMLSLVLQILEEWGELIVGVLTVFEANLLLSLPLLFTDPTLGMTFTIPAGLSVFAVGQVRNLIGIANLTLSNFEDAYGELLVTGNNLNQTVFTEFAYLIQTYLDALIKFEELVGNAIDEYNLLKNWGD